MRHIETAHRQENCLIIVLKYEQLSISYLLRSRAIYNSLLIVYERIVLTASTIEYAF